MILLQEGDATQATQVVSTLADLSLPLKGLMRFHEGAPLMTTYRWPTAIGLARAETVPPRPCRRLKARVSSSVCSPQRTTLHAGCLSGACLWPHRPVAIRVDLVASAYGSGRWDGIFFSLNPAPLAERGRSRDRNQQPVYVKQGYIKRLKNRTLSTCLG